MSALLISDLHLSPERPAITRAFIHFLSAHAAQVDELYILGDLFEAWIGDDDPSELAKQVKQSLRQLSDRGTAVFIQHGNRDFLLGKRFMREAAARLIEDIHSLEFCGTTTLLMHGDTLCTDDIDYQRFRRKSRRPIYRWCLSHLPLRHRQKLATRWRAKSRMANSNKASAIMDVNSDEVDRVMAQYGASCLIHGHTHRPQRHQLSNGGERLVLGDWHHHGWFVRIDENELALEKFAIDPT